MLRHRLPAATVAPRCLPTTTITDLLTPTTAAHLPIVHPATADRPTAALPLPTAHPATADRRIAALPLPAAHPATADRRTVAAPLLPTDHPATADRRAAALPLTVLPATADRPAAAHPAIADLRVHPITDRPVPTTLPPAAAVTPVLPVHPPVRAAVAIVAVHTPQAALTPAVHAPAVHPLPEDKISNGPTDYWHHYTNYHNLSLLQNIAGGFFASRRPVGTVREGD